MRIRRAFLIPALALALLAVPPPVPGAAAATAVDAIAITVSDLDRAVDFYSSVLGFEKTGEFEARGRPFELMRGLFGLSMRVARLRLGREEIELTEYLAPRGRPIPVDSRSQDRWFQHIAIVVRDMASAYRHLRERGVEHASTGPQRLPDWNPAAGGIEAFYFKDPDGHVLEVLSFPPGKGDPRWHRPGDRLFLGIDHTAIVVWDTEASLRFYRDLLGLRLAGGSENHGTEQEHLNNVFGARLRITTLRPDTGPGVELLEYLAPRDGRPYPADSRASDLWHWETRVRSGDLDGIDRALRGTRPHFVSPGIVDLPDDRWGFGRGLLVRDPDGHAVQIVSARENG